MIPPAYNPHQQTQQVGFLYRLPASIRANYWWQYKAAPLLGFVYLFIYINHIALKDSFTGIAASVITIIGIAGLGYVINDVYDIAFDKAAKKMNRLAALNYFQRAFIIFFLLLAAFLPWYWLPYDGVTIAMIIFQFSLYLLYSHPLVRLKEKHLWGVICDALYGHAMPAIIAIYTFHKIGENHFYQFRLFFCISFLWLFVKGLRNIIIHQLEDRKNDRATGFTTFVLRYKPLSSLQLLNNIILPVEMLLVAIWFWLVAQNVPVLAVVFCVFLLVAYFKFSGWKLEFLPFRQLWFKFLYFLNDLYETWLPLAAVLYLPFTDIRMLVFVLMHSLLFPGSWLQLGEDLKVILKNIPKGLADEQSRRSFFRNF